MGTKEGYVRAAASGGREFVRTAYTCPFVTRREAYLYDDAYAGAPNWDIGRPQAAFVHLTESGRVRGPVLDVGCGTGELALYLANQGYEVLGIDLAPRAIDQAKAKARWRRVDGAHFLIWDALDLPHLAAGGFRFRTVADSAMFHILAAQDREIFIDGLETVLAPGGLYCVLGDVRKHENGTYGITPSELRGRFRAEDGWSVEFVYETAFERRLGNTPAYIAGIRREGS